MAIDTIKSTAVLDGAIATADIADANITTAKIADNAVTSAKIATLTGDVSHGDSVKAKFGASDDLQVYHDGSNSYVRDSGTGNLRLTTESSVVLAKHNNENMLKADVDGAVTLYHDAGAKLATTATGVSVTGDLTIAGSGTGVYLGGTGSANKLDDYETGTYTPNLRTTTGGNLTMGMNKLSYTKIGNLVHVGGRINIASQSVSGRSGPILFDWPFAHGAGTDHSHWSSLTLTTHGINLDSGAIHLFSETNAGNSYGTLYQMFDNLQWSYLDGNVIKGDANEWIYVQGCYMT